MYDKETKTVLTNFTNKSKQKIKTYEELWSRIKALIRSITKNSDDYDEKYIKITFNLCDELPLNKTIEIVGGVFYENSKYYPQVFLDECWYKLSII